MRMLDIHKLVLASKDIYPEFSYENSSDIIQKIMFELNKGIKLFVFNGKIPMEIVRFMEDWCGKRDITDVGIVRSGKVTLNSFGDINYEIVRSFIKVKE